MLVGSHKIKFDIEIVYICCCLYSITRLHRAVYVYNFETCAGWVDLVFSNFMNLRVVCGFPIGTIRGIQKHFDLVQKARVPTTLKDLNFTKYLYLNFKFFNNFVLFEIF